MMVIRGKENPESGLKKGRKAENGGNREIVDILKKNRFFSEFPASHLKELSKKFVFRESPDAHFICRQGDRGDAIYVITDGNMEVIMNNGKCDEIIHVAGPGEILGEVAVLGDIPRTASLKARGKIKFLQIKRLDFIALLSQNPDMSLKVIKTMVRRLTNNMNNR